jgi:hypothetical protein
VLETEMGKKKERREREAREREAMHGGTKREGFEARWSAKAGKHGGAAPFAGIAAALTRQMGTAAGRQVIAAGLMMAANAITAKDARGCAPRPPEPPQPSARSFHRVSSARRPRRASMRR